jgi:4-hydroxybenzoate polyprenyltransferase
MRFDKPIGILLLLWPTLWALWLAAKGMPKLSILMIFILGVIVMRPAGCIINDITDRQFDGQVNRTCHRPLITGAVSLKEAWILFFILCLIGFLLVLQLNFLTIVIAFFALIFSSLYPLMKRYIPCPQLVLGLSWYLSIPMAFSAVLGKVPPVGWFVYAIAVLWTVIFDTFYAMADKADDEKIGIKSTAIWFSPYEPLILGILQGVFFIFLCMLGVFAHLSKHYFFCCFIVLGLMIYEQRLIFNKNSQNYLKAFKHNHWIGLLIFIGIFRGL